MILLDLFFTFFKIGLFTFGGGYAMLPLIQQEVAQKQWLTSEELLNFVGISESTPGPFAVNISTYIGVKMSGIPGALCATAGVVMPSFLIILLISYIYKKFASNKVTKGLLSGLKPAVVGLIATAFIKMINTVLIKNFDLNFYKDPRFYCTVVILGLGVFLMFRKINPIIMILISAVLGIGFGYLLMYFGYSI